MTQNFCTKKNCTFFHLNFLFFLWDNFKFFFPFLLFDSFSLQKSSILIIFNSRSSKMHQIWRFQFFLKEQSHILRGCFFRIFSYFDKVFFSFFSNFLQQISVWLLWILRETKKTFLLKKLFLKKCRIGTI